jgi:hypothetical protein
MMLSKGGRPRRSARGRACQDSTTFRRFWPRIREESVQSCCCGRAHGPNRVRVRVHGCTTGLTPGCGSGGDSRPSSRVVTSSYEVTNRLSTRSQVEDDKRTEPSSSREPTFEGAAVDLTKRATSLAPASTDWVVRHGGIRPGSVPPRPAVPASHPGGPTTPPIRPPAWARRSGRAGGETASSGSAALRPGAWPPARLPGQVRPARARAK